MIFQTTSLQTDESRSQEAPWRLNSKWGEWTHLWSCFSKYRRCYLYSVFKLRQCYSYYEVCQSKQRNGFIFEITEHQFAKHGEIWRDSDTRRIRVTPTMNWRLSQSCVGLPRECFEGRRYSSSGSQSHPVPKRKPSPRPTLAYYHTCSKRRRKFPPITVARSAPDATLKGVSVSMIHAIL